MSRRTSVNLACVVFLVLLFPVLANGQIINPVNLHTYQRIDVGFGFTWHQSRDSALALGGYLATITSAQEDSFLLQLVYPNSPTEVVYLGGTDEASEAAWKWVSGEPWSYTRWNPTNFDNQNGQQHYLVSLSGGWDDTYPYYPHPLSEFPGPVSFMVEWNTPASDTTACKVLVVTDKSPDAYSALFTATGLQPTYSGSYADFNPYEIVIVDLHTSSTPGVAAVLKPYVYQGGNVIVTEGNPYFLASPDFYEWFGASTYANSGGVARIVSDNPLGVSLELGDTLDDRTGHGFSFGAVDNVMASATPVARWDGGAGPCFSLYNQYGQGKVYYSARINFDNVDESVNAAAFEMLTAVLRWMTGDCCPCHCADMIAPVLSCQNDTTVNAQSGMCGAIVEFNHSASDNCTTLTVTTSVASGSLFSVGETPVTVIATDSTGNADTCTFVVTVNDVERPSVTCNFDTVVAAPRTAGGVTVAFASSLNDNCPGASVVCSPPSGSFFSFGSTPVQCIATDVSGNSDTCEFSIQVDTLCACPCASDPYCDGIRDIVDVVLVVNTAFRGGAPVTDSDCGYQRSDVDCSGATDVLDAVRIVNVAFRGAVPATEFCDPCP